ncbi:MAG: hypothetical protein K8T10_00485 [Candidatus Eremiobacteraeota bacterium]|nr:hypothetical protein [Candidatus Eremiobacteraeota bacterium]
MDNKVSHDRSEESIEAKVRWFKSLPVSERMEILCAFTDLALTINPDLPNKKDAKQTKGHIQIISLKDLISSKRASGREVDLEDVRLLELAENEKNA